MPVIACIGATSDGQLFNVNADTLAGSLAARAGRARLVIAGGTAGVLDAKGRTMADARRNGIGELVSSGTATAGWSRSCARAGRRSRAASAMSSIADGRAAQAAGGAADRTVRGARRVDEDR